MPDAHVGLGATVGSVIPTEGAVIPSPVGVDIGCGMVAAELDITEAQLPDALEPLLGRIERATQQEVHDGRELWVTRKGAIRASSGDLGVIPGSMGTRTYIVAGKGNPASWLSCAHGAGRRYTRTRAKKLFTTSDLAAQMA
jgi:RNA-splicing ligase RtcB